MSEEAFTIKMLNLQLNKKTHNGKDKAVIWHTAR